MLTHRDRILGELWLQAAGVRNVGYVSQPGSYRLATVVGSY